MINYINIKPIVIYGNPAQIVADEQEMTCDFFLILPYIISKG